MKKKKLPYILLAGVVVLMGILIMLLTIAGKHKETQENETQSVLYGVDVTNLQKRGAEQMKSVSDDTIYSKKLTKDNTDLNIDVLKTDAYVAAVYEFEKLYKAESTELYNRLNVEQLKADDIINFSSEKLESYLTDVLGKAEDITIFPLKTFQSERKGYIVVELCSATKTVGANGNTLYDYDTAKRARFTFWIDNDGFSFVPYSVVEGTPAEILQEQQAMPSVVTEEAETMISDTQMPNERQSNGS